MATRTVQVDPPRRIPRLVWLLLLALVVRVGVLFVVPGALAGDPDGYRALAENLWEHGTLGEGTQPTAYRPPLYPMLLLPCVALGKGAVATWAIGVLHVMLGVGTVGLVWWLGRRCGLGPWAWAAGALVACDPILLGQSAVVMTETAAAFLVALALVGLVGFVEAPSWRRGVAAGVALGACGLCRPELLIWAAVCVPGLLVARGAMPALAVGMPEGVRAWPRKRGHGTQRGHGTRHATRPPGEDPAYPGLDFLCVSK